MSKARYKTSPGAAFSVKYHIVWCPKYRKRVLIDPVDTRLKALLYEIAENIGTVIQAMEVMPDHVHLFVEADATRAPAELANRFKGATSRLLREEFPHLRRVLPCLWSRSYFVGTVGHVSDATVRKYIAMQKVRAA
jgi:putative transposase